MKGLWLVALLFFVAAAAHAEAPPCYKDLELNFFRTDLVNEALSLHKIPQSNWNLINYELKNRVKRVPEMIKQRAKKMDPNPLATPFLPELAQQLLDSVLIDIFQETLSVFHLNNTEQTKEMYNYIREKQKQRMISCFGEEKKL